MKKFIFTASEAEQAVKKYREEFVHSRTMRNVFKIIQQESKKGNKGRTFYFDSWSVCRCVFNELYKLGYRLEKSELGTQHILKVSW